MPGSRKEAAESEVLRKPGTRQEVGNLLVLALLIILAFLSMDAALFNSRCFQSLFLKALVLHTPRGELCDRAFISSVISLFTLMAAGLFSWRRQTRETLWQGERLLASIFASVQEGLIIKDAEFNIIRVNPVVERWFAHALPLVGRKCYQALKGRQEPCEGCPSRQALETGQAAHGVVPKPGPGGEEVGWLDLYAFPLVDPATGKMSGVIEFLRDITERIQAEEALKQSEEKYRLLVNQIPAIVFKGYGDWSVDFFDRKIEDLTGYSKKDFDSRKVKWCDLIPPEDFDYAQNIFIEALKTNKSYVREHRIRKKTGDIRWVQCRGQIFCNAAGEVDYISGVTFDITDRKQAEEALQESEQRYRLLVKNMPAVVFKGYLDWTIDLMDDKIQELTGYTKEDFNSRRLKWTDVILLEDLKGAQQVFLQALKTTRSYVREYRIRHKDGRILWIHARGQILCDLQGKVEYISGVFFDVTEHRGAEEALKKSQASLAEAQRIAHIGNWEWDIAADELHWSDEIYRIFGLTPQQFESTYEAFLQAVHPDDRLRVQEAVNAALYQGKPYQIGHRILRPDGQEGFVFEQGEVTFDAGGRPVRMLGTVQDITSRKQLEEQLGQAQKMEVVGRLAGGVAHDFNNLLTAILGYCELLLVAMPEQAPERQDVLEIKRAGERAALLTRQLLAFSRRQVLQPKLLNLNGVIDNLGKMLKRVIGEDIELTILPGPELGRVMADPGQIEQVILNLAVNARDAMPQGGRLSIKTANVDLDASYARLHAGVERGPYVLLAVSDTGCGMDPATRANIFEPFFTTKEMGKGTGLGLSMVYGIVKQSGGHIWVYSEPGQGTTFKIYLPRLDAAQEAAAEERVAKSPPPGRETILLVEDEEVVRQIARRILQGQGYTVLDAKDGQEALEVMEQHPGAVHLMLTDLVMPGMNGRELALQMRARRPEMKILYMSGYAENGIVNQGVLEQGIIYIQKPFEARVLARRVRELLDTSPPRH